LNDALRSGFNNFRSDAARFWGHAASATVLFLRRRFGGVLRRPMSDEALGVALREILDRSGVVGRKLGQFLALRLDFVPRGVAVELEKLFDSGEPMPFALVRAAIESEFGRPLEQMFRTFETEPIGVASIAQVHKAVATDGQVVAVKVQRAGVAAALESELRILRRIARWSDALRLTGTLSAREALDEFADFTLRELSFDSEGTTADRFRMILGPGAHAPAVRWDLTASRVLTMEFVNGVTLLEICRLYERGQKDQIERALPGVDLRAVVDRVAHETFHQLFDVGLFHGDPNPGNIIIQPDGTFTFIDFGVFGELDSTDRENLLGYTETLVQGRCLDSARYYLRLCRPSPATRVAELEVELAATIAAWREVLQIPNAPIEQRHISVWQFRVADLLRKFHVRSRRNLLLVWRAWVMLDSTALKLPIDFDLIRTQARYFASRNVRRMIRRLEPLRDRQRLLELSADTAADAAALRKLPQRLHVRETLARDSSRQRRRNDIGVAFAALLVGLAVLIGALSITPAKPTHESAPHAGRSSSRLPV
jgi:ubiquinone biosynthesis protein